MLSYELAISEALPFHSHFCLIDISQCNNDLHFEINSHNVSKVECGILLLYVIFICIYVLVSATVVFKTLFLGSDT